MTALEPITLHEAEMAVAVANTPIFLARRLLENAAVSRALTLHGPERIYAALQSVAAQPPANLSAVTEVYFYLVALSLAPDKSWLRRSAGMEVPHVKWFVDIAEYLSDTAKVTVRKMLDLTNEGLPNAPTKITPGYIGTANTQPRLIKL